MQFKFKEWSLGGKLIFISTVLAIVSLFMTWVDTEGVELSGFQQKGYIFILQHLSY